MILECEAFTMEQGGKAQRETSPPPPRQPSASPRGCAVPTTCLRRACNATDGRRKGRPTPPHHHHPPEGECGKGGGEKRPPPPPPRTTRQGGGAEEGECETSHTTVPVEGALRASPGGGTTGGAGVG